MRTDLHHSLRDTLAGQEAESILRKCVHCGFCNATCPTYQLLGDELDGPRGRIYLIKEALEGSPPTRRTQQHLDRCLTCRACETTCPSGVSYGRLLDIGRAHVNEVVTRGPLQRMIRKLLLATIPWRARFRLLASIGQTLRALPAPRPPGEWPIARHGRRMLVLEGCVQPTAAPSINAAAARLLDQLGISLIKTKDGCCGAMAHHLDAEAQSRAHMRHNIDIWWPEIERGAEAVVATASGCGTQLRDYGRFLHDDPVYAAKAARVSALFLDLSEVVARELQRSDARALHAAAPKSAMRVAFQAPCSLQHGLAIRGAVESILRNAGFSLVPVANGHLCCGSAGTYSILQRGLSQRLRADKLAALQANAPEVIATANIGCMLHLATAANVPVRHWVELLDESAALPRH